MGTLPLLGGGKVPIIDRVAARHVLNKEVRRFTTARRANAKAKDLTTDVMLSFAHASRIATVKQALGLASKLKTLWEMFNTQKGAWESFKDMIGVRAESYLETLRELPSKIKAFVQKGTNVLAKAGNFLADNVPFFQVYVDAQKKMPSLNTLLLRLVDYLPRPLSQGLKKIGEGVTSFAAQLDIYVQKHPLTMVTGTLLSAAIFTVIWLNVTEISWDIPDILKGFLGMYSFAELLKSLPEAGIGLLLSLMFPGLPSKYLLNAILPVTVALRIAWLVGQRYATWENGKLTLHWEEMGVPPIAL